MKNPSICRRVDLRAGRRDLAASRTAAGAQSHQRRTCGSQATCRCALPDIDDLLQRAYWRWSRDWTHGARRVRLTGSRPACLIVSDTACEGHNDGALVGDVGRATLCYMRTVTHREMRNNSAEILRAVAAGEVVQVTNHGRVAAVISPPNQPALARLVADGQARPARQLINQLSTIKRRASVLTSAELLDDVRRRW